MLELYVDSGRRYPQEYCGNSRCHLRALWNVCPLAAKEVKDRDIHYTEKEEIHGVLKNHEDERTGEVFFIQKKHRVALEKGDGEKNAWFYDDAVRLEISNYDGALAVLQLAQDMSQKGYEKNMHGKATSKKTNAARKKFEKMAQRQKAAVCIVC